MRATSSGNEEIKCIKLRHKGQDFNLVHKRNLGYRFENNYTPKIAELNIDFDDSIEIDILIDALQEFENNVVRWGGIWKKEEEVVRSDF